MIRAMAAPVLAYLIAAIDIQPYLTLGGVVLALVLGWRAFKVRDFQGEITGLKASNDTHEIVKRADDARIRQLQEELNGAQARANAAEANAGKWEAKFTAIEPYSAGPAFEKLAALIAQMAEAGDKRHSETIDLIRRLAGEKSVNP